MTVDELQFVVLQAFTHLVGRDLLAIENVDVGSGTRSEGGVGHVALLVLVHVAVAVVVRLG